MGETNVAISLDDVNLVRHEQVGTVDIRQSAESYDGLWYSDRVIAYTKWSFVQFYSYTRRGILKSVRRGSRGRALFDPKEVQELVANPPPLAFIRQKKKNHAQQKEYGYTIDESRPILNALFAGETLAEVMKKNLHVHPVLIMELFKEYVRVSGAIVLNPGTVEKINALDLDCAMPVKTEVDVFRALQSAEKERCHSSGCLKKRSGRCESCIRKRVMKSLTVRERHGLDPISEARAQEIINVEIPEKFQRPNG